MDNKYLIAAIRSLFEYLHKFGTKPFSDKERPDCAQLIVEKGEIEKPADVKENLRVFKLIKQVSYKDNDGKDILVTMEVLVYAGGKD